VRWVHKLLVNRAMPFFEVASSPDVRHIHTAARGKHLAATACPDARMAGAADALRLRIGFLAAPCILPHGTARRAAEHPLMRTEGLR